MQQAKKQSPQSPTECCSEAGDCDEAGQHPQHHHGGIRHNPQPHRCVHICALQGCQVPSVVDDGMPLDFHICYPTAKPETLNAAAEHPESLRQLVKSRHLNQFHQLPQETPGQPWRLALAKLAKETFRDAGDSSSQLHHEPSDDGQHRLAPLRERQLQRLYSPLTGRLVAGQALPSAASASNRRESVTFEKIELLQSSVMGMLCRILQTQDEAAVRAWLVAATPRERVLVTDIIRSSVANRDEYFLASPLGLGDLAALGSPQSRGSTRAKSVISSPASTISQKSGGGGRWATQQPGSPASSAGPDSAKRSSTAADGAQRMLGTQQTRLAPVLPAGRKTRLPSGPSSADCAIKEAAGVRGARKPLCKPGQTKPK